MPEMSRSFDWKAAYAILNTGAHRKHWPLLGAPGVVQHLAFRIPQPVVTSGIGASSTGNSQAHEPLRTGDVRDAWHRCIDTFLARIFLLLLEDAIGQSGSHKAPDYFVCPNWDKSEGKLYLLRHQFPQLNDGTSAPRRSGVDLEKITKVSRAIRFEIFTLLTIYKGIPLTVRAELRHEFWTLSFLADFSKKLPAEGSWDVANQMVQAFQSVANVFHRRVPLSTGGRDLRDADKLQIFEAGKALTSLFPNLLDQELVQPSMGYVDTLGDKFADFRGIATRVNIENAPGEGSPTYTMADVYSQDPNNRQAIDAIVREPPYDAPHALRIVDALWPAVKELFARHEVGDALRQNDKSEFSICRMQGSRSLYISSLGRYTSNDAVVVEPVRFMLVTSSRSRWQLGRLAERITHLGTLRLAAIYDIDKIQEASDKLDALVSKWQEKQFELATLPGGGRLDAAQDVLKELNAIERELPGGLMSRISRSSYYVETFHDVLRDMRIDPVDGFQTYPVFVRRRMGATFDFIKRVGRRRDALHEDILLSFDGETARQTMRGVKATERLLKRAEWFLAVSAVYYGGTIVAHFVDLFFPSVDHRWSLAGYAIGIVIAGTALARHRLFPRKKKQQAPAAI